MDRYVYSHKCSLFPEALNNQETDEVQVKVLVTQLCPTLYNPVDCSSPGFSVHGILQARILEWVAISFSRGSSQPRDRTQISCIAGRFFTRWATREAQGSRHSSNPLSSFILTTGTLITWSTQLS